MSKSKMYAVEVLERCSHGRYGKELMFQLCLCTTSIARAKDFAFDVLAGMTKNEILLACTNDSARSYIELLWPLRNLNDTPIGFENAIKFFSTKAYFDHYE